MRVLPDFLIIGAQKAGTTSFFNYVGEHPCVVRDIWKEIDFFDKYYSKGFGWYRSFFPTQRYKDMLRRRRNGDILTGESSPSYLFDPVTPGRVRKILPSVKLIVLLRDPVDRAFSHYQHNIRTAKPENLTFEEAVEKEPERLAGGIVKINGDGYYASYDCRLYSYLARGVYVDQLKRWMSFFPKEQFLILKTEELASRPDAAMDEVFRFLGLPPFRLKAYRRSNEGIYKQTMSPETRKCLTEYFAPHNRRLYEFLGRDFGWESRSRETAP